MLRYESHDGKHYMDLGDERPSIESWNHSATVDENIKIQIDEKRKIRQRRAKRAKDRTSLLNGRRQCSKSILAFGLRCQSHANLALFRAKVANKSSLYWLPYIRNLNPKSSAHKQINGFLHECYEATFGKSICLLKTSSLNEFVDKTHLLSWVKVAPFPSILPVFDQKIYIADIHPEFCFCDQKNGPLNWIPFSSFKNHKNNNDNECNIEGMNESIHILGVEVDKVVEAFQNKANIFQIKKVSSSYEEITETEILYLLETNQYKDHMERVGYNKAKVFKLYQDFQNMSYPSLTLCEVSFKAFFSYFLEEISKKEFHLRELFRAFSHVNGKYLTFSEMLLGLSLIEPEASLSTLRVPFIFDYFRSGSNIKMNHSLKYVQKNAETNQDEHGEISISFSEFQRKSLKIENSNRILKVQKSLIDSICCKDLFPKNTILNDIPENSIDYYQKSCCSLQEMPQLVPYWMDHETKLLNRISDIEIKNYAQIPTQKNSNIPVATLLSDIKQLAYETLQELRLFKPETNEKQEKFARNERFYNVITVQNMVRIFDATRKLFLSESSLLKISSPCLVFGDIHGNLHDLLFFEKHFWPHSPIIHPLNTLFLGDYVDRGELSLECALYLFSMKILLPDKILMLRGNHELRHVQTSYTFEKECLTKLGKREGKLVFETVNKAFDSLPLAAVIGGRLFCAHGGIPATDNCLENISQIDKTIFSEHKTDKVSRAESQSPIAWQLLWNDPFEDDRYFREYLGTCMWSTDVEFIPNIARGTAMYFLQNSVRDFIEKNQLSYVIRAHECPFFGSRLQFDNRLCTVFSSSNYCGKNNFSGFLLVDKPEILRNAFVETNFKVGMIHRFSIDRPQIEPDWLKNAKAQENSQKDE